MEHLRPMDRSCCLTCLIAFAVFSTGGILFAADETVTLDLGSGVKLELIRVSKGTFTQGSPATEPGRGEDETPREVTISKDYFIGKYPVTRGQFAEFVKHTKYKTEAESGPSGGFGWDGKALVQRKEYTWKSPGFPQTDEHPVTLVTYHDAEAFLAWVSKKTGRKLVLPTEAQWEYACRAGTTTPFSGGETERQLAEQAWYKANAGDGTRPVGSKAANAWGLFDMSGNGYEWCRDWYAPYAAGPATDPEQTRSNLSDKPRRVLRGGAFHKEARHCRSAARYRNDPKSRNADNGFRLSMAASDAPVGQPPIESPVKPGDTAPSISPPFQPPEIPTTHDGHAEHSAPHAAPPMQTATGTPNWLSGLCCCLAVGLGVLFLPIAYFMMRGSGGAQASDYAVGRDPTIKPPAPAPQVFTPPPATGGTRTRLAADGFWLDVSNIAAGSVVDYSCVVQGATQFNQITATGGVNEMFVYTGGTPTNVQVLNVSPPGSEPDSGQFHTGPGIFPISGSTSRPIGPPRTSTPPRHDDRTPPFTGYPSAY